MPPNSTPGRRAMGCVFPPSSGAGSARPTLSGKGVMGSGGKGRGVGGRGVGVNRMKRQRKLLKDTIQGITKGDIRRMARRGGVKRISAMIYSDMREAMKAHLEKILRDVAYVVEYQQRKTVTVTDVVFVLKKQGRPIYGFDTDSHTPGRYAKRVS